MSTGYFDFWPPQPQRLFGEIMDELFNLWIQDTTNKTFEEFCSIC